MPIPDSLRTHDHLSDGRKRRSSERNCCRGECVSVISGSTCSTSHLLIHTLHYPCGRHHKRKCHVRITCRHKGLCAKMIEADGVLTVKPRGPTRYASLPHEHDFVHVETCANDSFMTLAHAVVAPTGAVGDAKPPTLDNKGACTAIKAGTVLATDIHTVTAGIVLNVALPCCVGTSR